jgi:large subunit ribosomal protein L4
MQVELKNINGEVIKKITLSDFVWKQDMNEGLVHQVVVAQRNNMRQGTSSTLRRRDANYSTVKLRAQKGGGRARVGSRSSHVLGNSVAHGPQPRSFSQKVHKKMRKASIRMILSEKLKDGEITLLEKFEIKDISSRNIANIIKKFGFIGKSLVVLEKSEIQANLLSSVRNVQNIRTMASDLINTYDLMASKNLVITQQAMKSIESIWDNKNIKSKVSK